MQRFVSFVLVLLLVSVWSAPAEVINIPALATRASQDLEDDILREMEVLEAMNRISPNLQTPVDLLKILGGLQSSPKDNEGYSTRLKDNFENKMEPNTRKNDHTPQETVIRNKYPLNGDSVVKDADQEAVTTEIIHNNLRQNYLSFFDPVIRTPGDDMIGSIPYMPFEMDVPTKVFTWLGSIALDIIARLGSRDRPKRDVTSSAILKENINRIMLDVL